MAEETQVNWDEALSNNNYVKLEAEETKTLKLLNYKLVKVEKFGKPAVEFQADVLEEDGEPVKDKKFTSSSNRLKKKLKPLLEGKASTDEITLSIMMVGEGYDTQYSVKLIE